MFKIKDVTTVRSYIYVSYTELFYRVQFGKVKKVKSSRLQAWLWPRQ